VKRKHLKKPTKPDTPALEPDKQSFVARLKPDWEEADPVMIEQKLSISVIVEALDYVSKASVGYMMERKDLRSQTWEIEFYCKIEGPKSDVPTWGMIASEVVEITSEELEEIRDGILKADDQDTDTEKESTQ